LLASLRVMDLRAEMENMLNRRGTVTRLFDALEAEETLLKKWAAGLVEMRAGLWGQKLAENPEISGVMDDVLGVEIIAPADKLAPAVAHAQAGVRAARQNDYPRAVEQWAQINRSGGRAANWGGKDGKAQLSKELLAPLQAFGKALRDPFALEIGPDDEAAAQNLHLWRALWAQLDAAYT
ncbi:MAG: hypothetical protein GY797_38465, partial [Deltaproteobacteria bacterium]|nr:hypothetical protein [Deltaproteobacteria bacterium]